MSDAVQQIKERLNILDVVSPYVELHKAGKNFKGKSPFSAEKTPSFFVSPDRGMYYCFSTSQGGDIFNFIQAMEGVDFKGALEMLAQKAGVELIPEDPRKRSERERLYAAVEAAAVFYEEQLPTEAEALEYLKKRGVRKDTITKWRIGFAPGPPKRGWRESKEALEEQGFTKDELLKAGIIKSAEGGKEPFDVFRDRIMFPMSEPSGKVVAFSGRILHPDDKAPKYVNSPETPLYKKSDLLFGYDKAKEGIRKLNFSLIVEGQFDVVMCHQAGYHNTVAVSGTALTLHHVQLLERLSDKVVLALDADRAGIAAMKKAAAVMLRRGLDVKVSEMPLGEDPADMIAKGTDDFKKVIGKSVHVIEFLLHVICREEKDERTLKRRAREEILPFILLLPDRIDQEHFVGKVAESIGTTIEAVRFELDRLREQAVTPNSDTKVVSGMESTSTKPNQSTVNMSHKAHTYLICAVDLLEPSFSSQIKKELKHLQELGTLGEPLESEKAGVLFLLEQQYATMSPLAVTEEVVAKLNQLKTLLLKEKLSLLREQLAKVESEDNEVEMAKLLSKIGNYETKLREPAYQVETFLST